jgi:hypothetical protein
MRSALVSNSPNQHLTGGCHEPSGRHSLAVSGDFVRGRVSTLSTQWTLTNQEESHVEQQRDSLALGLGVQKIYGEQHTLSTWRTKMQTEIEILETRENPSILWA